LPPSSDRFQFTVACSLFTVLLREYAEPLLRRFHREKLRALLCLCAPTRLTPPNAKERIMQFDLYETITKQVMAMLEQGVVPWRSPILGKTSAGHPKNLESGKPYRGINVFLLAFTAYARGYESSYWLTFNQAKERGGSVRKGEKASMVVFWKQFETEDKDTHMPTKIPVLRYYNVFNAGQCDGLEVPDAPKFDPI